MTTDQDLSTHLAKPPPFDPTFRVAVLNRICKKARHRQALRQATLWIGGSILLGLIAQSLTPTAGNPALETAAMALSLVVFAVLLTTGARIPRYVPNPSEN